MFESSTVVTQTNSSAVKREKKINLLLLTNYNHMVSSVSSRDEPNPVLPFIIGLHVHVHL